MAIYNPGGGGIPYEKVGMLIGKFSRTELLEKINLDMTWALFHALEDTTLKQTNKQLRVVAKKN